VQDTTPHQRQCHDHEHVYISQGSESTSSTRSTVTNTMQQMHTEQYRLLIIMVTKCNMLGKIKLHLAK